MGICLQLGSKIRIYLQPTSTYRWMLASLQLVVRGISGLREESPGAGRDWLCRPRARADNVIDVYSITRLVYLLHTSSPVARVCRVCSLVHFLHQGRSPDWFHFRGFGVWLLLQSVSRYALVTFLFLVGVGTSWETWFSHWFRWWRSLSFASIRLSIMINHQSSTIHHHLPRWHYTVTQTTQCFLVKWLSYHNEIFQGK